LLIFGRLRRTDDLDRGKSPLKTKANHPFFTGLLQKDLKQNEYASPGVDHY
jgi:hypothetical protein